jgi:hypothetical protein
VSKYTTNKICFFYFSVFFGKVVSITSGSTPTDPGETVYHIKILFVLKVYIYIFQSEGKLINNVIIFVRQEM